MSTEYISSLEEYFASTQGDADAEGADIAKRQKLIDDTIAKLEEDIAAWDTDEFKEALCELYETDSQEYRRVYHRLKKHRIAGEVEREIKIFLRRRKKQKNPSLPSLPAIPRVSEDITLHQSFTFFTQDSKDTLKIEKDALVAFDSGRPAVVVESEAAVIIAEALRGFAAYDDGAKTWFTFNGAHWSECNQDQIDAVLIGLLYQGAAMTGFTLAYKNNIRGMIAGAGFLPMPKSAKGLLPFINGVLDINAKILRPATPETAQTWCLPYAYTPQADCPNIKEWLLQAVDGDAATVEFLRAWLAALLHGRSDLQKFLHLIGSGGTGKGVFIRLASALIGEHNAASTTLNEMEGNRFECARFYGKRLIKITDSNRYGGSVDTFKALTGQDVIRLERKHQQQSGGFVFEGLVLMASNEQLATTDHSSGLDRRRLMVEFDRRATDAEKQDWAKRGGEEAVLHTELPGLVNWLLAFSQDEIGRIIRTPPERTRAANFKAMTAGNPIAEWITEHCTQDVTAWTQVGDKREIRAQGAETTFEDADTKLYPNYLQWCQRHHRAPCSIRRFREIVVDTLKTMNIDVIEVRRNTGQGIQGVRLRNPWEPINATPSQKPDAITL